MYIIIYHHLSNYYFIKISYFYSLNQMKNWFEKLLKTFSKFDNQLFYF